MPVICICLSPGFQHTVFIDTLIPGEVNRLGEVFVDVAGKGVNVCRVLQQLGHRAVCLAQGGSNADEADALARRDGLDLRLTPSSGRLRTCTSIVETRAGRGNRVTELVEPSSRVDESCAAALCKTVEEMLPSASALVVAGSMAPGFPAGYPARLAGLARKSGVPVFLDMQGPELRAALAAGPAVVKINLDEFVATFLAGRFRSSEKSGNLAEAAPSAEILHAVADASRFHTAAFVLTRGAASTLLARGGAVRALPVPLLSAAETINPIGCGDAFLAGMLAHLLAIDAPRPWDNLPIEVLEKAIEFATACARANARSTRPGMLDDAFLLTRT